MSAYSQPFHQTLRTHSLVTSPRGVNALLEPESGASSPIPSMHHARSMHTSATQCNEFLPYVHERDAVGRLITSSRKALLAPTKNGDNSISTSARQINLNNNAASNNSVVSVSSEIKDQFEKKDRFRQMLHSTTTNKSLELFYSRKSLYWKQEGLLKALKNHSHSIHAEMLQMPTLPNMRNQTELQTVVDEEKMAQSIENSFKVNAPHIRSPCNSIHDQAKQKYRSKNKKKLKSIGLFEFKTPTVGQYPMEKHIEVRQKRQPQWSFGNTPKHIAYGSTHRDSATLNTMQSDSLMSPKIYSTRDVGVTQPDQLHAVSSLPVIKIKKNNRIVVEMLEHRQRSKQLSLQPIKNFEKWPDEWHKKFERTKDMARKIKDGILHLVDKRLDMHAKYEKYVKPRH